MFYLVTLFVFIYFSLFPKKKEDLPSQPHFLSQESRYTLRKEFTPKESREQKGLYRINSLGPELIFSWTYLINLLVFIKPQASPKERV